VGHLDLKANTITALAPKTFTGLGSVFYLDFFSNQITALEGSSSRAGLGRVKTFYLADNHIIVRGPDTFANLGSVRSLRLSDNQPF